MVLLSWPHPSWWPLLILFICASVQSTSLLKLQDALTLFLYSLWAVLTDILSVLEQERQSLEAGSSSESWWASSWHTGVWGHLVSSILGAACHYIIISIGWPSSGTGGRAGGLSSWLSRDSPGLWCWVRHMVIALCGAMFTPNPDFWRGNVSPLNVKTVRWATGRVVPLSPWRNGQASKRTS